MREIFHCAQNTQEWAELRSGIVTCSELKCVIAKGEGKTRRAYMLRLAGERLTGLPAETYENGHMIRGREMEDEARRLYAFAHDIELQSVGFIRNGPVGYSPDSLVGEHGALEIKTKLPHLQIDVLLSDKMPPEHKAQIQGGLWVGELEFIDFISYWPNLPPFIKRQHRDEEYIRMLNDETNRFNDELGEIVQRIQHYGMPLTEVLQQSLASA